MITEVKEAQKVMDAYVNQNNISQLELRMLSAENVRHRVDKLLRNKDFIKDIIEFSQETDTPVVAKEDEEGNMTLDIELIMLTFDYALNEFNQKNERNCIIMAANIINDAIENNYVLPILTTPKDAVIN